MSWSMDSVDGRVGSRNDRLFWKIIATGLFTALVITLLVRYAVGADDLADAVRCTRWSLLPIPVALASLSVVLAVVRWQIILRAMGYRLKLVRGLTVILATWPLAVVTPSRASDLLRAVLIRRTVPLYSGLGSILTEKIVDVHSLCLLCMIGTLWQGLWLWLAIAGGLVVALWVSVLLLLFNRHALARLPVFRRMSERVDQLFGAMDSLRRNPKDLLVLTTVSLASWIIAMGTIYSLLVMTGSGVGFGQVLSLWPISTLAGVLPVTMAGMGTRDAAFLCLLELAHAAAARGPVLVATFSYALVTTWLYALAGIPFMARVFIFGRGVDGVDVVRSPEDGSVTTAAGSSIR